MRNGKSSYKLAYLLLGGAQSFEENKPFLGAGWLSRAPPPSSFLVHSRHLRLSELWMFYLQGSIWMAHHHAPLEMIYWLPNNQCILLELTNLLPIHGAGYLANWLSLTNMLYLITNHPLQTAEQPPNSLHKDTGFPVEGSHSPQLYSNVLEDWH